MYSWSVNTSMIYHHQFSTTGSHFVLIYIIITQLPPLQVNYSSPHSEQIHIYKKSIIIRAVNAWNKIQTAFGDVILKNLTTTQIKTLLKNTLINIDKYFT